LAPLVYGRVYQLIVVAGERNRGPVRLEEILIDVEAFAEGFERRFEQLHCILLFVVIEAFVVNACDAQHHPEVATLGEKSCLSPEPV
jgi:hypothetical protein